MLRGLDSNHKRAKEYFPLLKSLSHDQMLSILSKPLAPELGISCTRDLLGFQCKIYCTAIRLETSTAWSVLNGISMRFSPQASRLLLELLKVALRGLAEYEQICPD
jgi:hypothetical protein